MQSRHTVRSALAVAAAAAGLVVGALAVPAGAAGSATIKGVVTQNGQPMSFAKVQIFPYLPDDGGDEALVGQRLKTDNTDSSGRYSFSGLKATATTKMYAVLVTDRTGRTVTTYRNVVVKSGRTITKNVHMRAAAILRGTIATSDGRSPAGLTVSTEPGNVNDWGPTHAKLYPEFSTTVRSDGTFALKGITSGTGYEHIRVSDGRYADQCYDFVANVLADCATKSNQEPAYYERQRINLSKGEQRTLPSVTMSAFAPPVTTVTGRVTDTSGKPLKGITVRIFADDVDQSVTTRSSGRYSFKDRLPAGSYTVRFDDPKRVWASQYLGGGPDKSVRQPIIVTPGRPRIAGVDTKLKSLAATKIATKGGRGSAKVAFQIRRKVSGSAPGGTLILSFDDITKTVKVVKGRATVTLTGLPAGTQSLVADYSGTGSTAEFSRVVKVLVK